GRETIEHLCASFGSLNNVAEVRSLTQPLGEPLPAPAAPLKTDGILGKLFQAVEPGVNLALEAARQASLNHYVAKLPEAGGVGRPAPSAGRWVTRLDLVLRSDPFDGASMSTLGAVQAFMKHELPRCPQPPGGMDAECYGVTVNAQDLAEVT